MKPNNLQTKQLKTAIYTSPVIGVLGSTPIFIAHSHSFGVFHLGVLLVTALVFCIWVINMGITGFYGYDSAGKWSHMLRYQLSYLFVLLFILFLKHTLGPLAHNGRDVRFADYARFMQGRQNS